MSRKLNAGEARSAGSLVTQRIKQPWPVDRDFRILSIDGGGIKGIFPASVLAELEHRLGSDTKIADYFDLITGTSTGGILALGLGAGYTAAELSELYINRGNEIFPPVREGRIGSVVLALKKFRQLGQYRYDSEALQAMLTGVLGERLLGVSTKRLCIPAFEAKHSEVCVYKTPHHPDYKTDLHKLMVDIGLATSAAPGFFRPQEQDGYVLVDGGIWANNPIQVALLEALTAFDIQPRQIKIFSLGCGDDPYIVDKWQIQLGGFFFWRKIIEAAMRLQSLNATNQARLLLSPENIVRIVPPRSKPIIEMDDWRRAKELLPPAAVEAVDAQFDKIMRSFLYSPAAEYAPVAEHIQQIAA